MTKESPNPNGGEKPTFDLEERTALFGEAVLQFAKKIPVNPVTKPLINQLVRAGTSAGANYCEADDAVSKKDFKNKIGTCRKEARETKLWLRMIATAEPETKPDARKLWQEAKELHLIFAAIWRKS
jgi:four helix bundle protein